jgi:hypothetical protein
MDGNSDAAERGEETEPDTYANISADFESEQNSSTNLEATSDIASLKLPLTPSKVLHKICSVPHISVKKPTEKQLTTVLISTFRTVCK